MKRILLTVFMVFTLLLPLCAYTYEDLYQSMLINNTDLREADQAIRMSHLDVKDAQANYHPQIELQGGIAYMINPLTDPLTINSNELLPQLGLPTMPASYDIELWEGLENTMYSLSVNLTQPLITWGKLPNAVNMYKELEGVKQIQKTDLEKQLTVQLKAMLAALYYIDDVLGYLESTVSITDELFMEIAESNFNLDNIYDQAQLRNVKIAQFGYDKDMTGRYEAVDAVFKDPALLSRLQEYRSTDPSNATISIFDKDIDDAISGLDGEAGSFNISTRYGDFIQQTVNELGLDEDEAMYLSRSLNQYAATANEWNSDMWKKHLTALQTDPRVTETYYRQSVESLRRAGLIDTATYDEFINGKSSPYQKGIDKFMDYVGVRVSQNAGLNEDSDYTGKMRWNELKHSSDFAANVERIVTETLSSGGSLDEAAKTYADNLIRVLLDDDLSDTVYKSADAILEDVVNYNPNDGFTASDMSLQELNSQFVSSGNLPWVDMEGIGAGTEYLQGSPSTRTSAGLYEAVTKAMYGSSASWETLTGSEREFVKANAGVALGQFDQYNRGAKTFERRGVDFSTVYVEGFGSAAMDSEGFIYLPQQDGSFTVLYPRDPAYRRELMRDSGTDRIVSMEDPRFNMGFYRERWEDRAFRPEEIPEGRTPEDMQNPWIDQTFGINTQPIDETSSEYVPQGVRRLVPASQDKVFAGLRTSLMTMGGPVNV